MLLVYFLLFKTGSKNTPTVTLNTCPGTPRMTFYYEFDFAEGFGTSIADFFQIFSLIASFNQKL